MKRLVMLVLILTLSLLGVVYAQEYGLLWKYRTGSDVESVSITSDGEYIAAGNGDKNVYLFVSSQVISKTIEEVKSIISQIKLKYNVSEAEYLLSQAEEAFKAGKYDKARSYALKAKSIALDIDQDGVPNEEDFAPYTNNYYIYASGITIMLISAISGKKYYAYRKRKKEELKREKREIIRQLEELLK